MENKHSSIILTDEKKLHIQGAEKLIEITSTFFSCICAGEKLVANGKDFVLSKLSLESGEIVIDGKISQIKFAKKTDASGFFKRVFK